MFVKGRGPKKDEPAAWSAAHNLIDGDDLGEDRDEGLRDNTAGTGNWSPPRFLYQVAIVGNGKMKFRYTKHQIPKGAHADAESYDKLFLLKNVSTMRLTYQVRLLTFRASESNKRLVVRVPKHCKVHPSLWAFVKELPKAVQVEKV